MAPKSNIEEPEAESFYDRFGSVVSLEERALVHGKGGCNGNGAVKVFNGARESVAAATISYSNGDVKHREYSWSSGSDYPEKKRMGRGTAKLNYICLPSAKVSVSNGTGKKEMEFKSSTMGSYMGGKSMKVVSNKIWQPKSQGQPTVLRCLDDEVKNGRLSESSSCRSAGSSSLPHKPKQYVWRKTAANSVSNGTEKNEMERKSSTLGSDRGGKSIKVDSNEIWLPKSQGEPTVLRSLDDEVNNGRISELSLCHSAGSSSLPHKAKQYVWRKTATNSVSNVIGEDGGSYSFPKNGSSMAAKPLKLESTVASQSSSQKEPSTHAFSKSVSSVAKKQLKLCPTVIAPSNSQRTPSMYDFSRNGYPMATKTQKLNSTVIPSTYAFSKNYYSETTKPTNIDSIRMSQSNSQRKPSTQYSEKYSTMHKDMEDLLVKMLGEGFQLERDAIRDILEKCGYDMTKCLDRASNLSAATLANKKCNSHSDKFRELSPKPELYSPQSNLQNRYSRGDVIANDKEPNKNQKDNDRLQNEIWYSLCDVSKKNEESPKAVQSLRKSVALSEVVVEPFKKPTINENVYLTLSRQNDVSGENANYQLLRRAVTEHRATMREYYRDAVRAFSEGDYAKADKLLKQGTFFKDKAVEADEESYKQLINTRNAQTDNEVLLDLHDQGAKEAVHFLKCHLSTLAGIPSLKYLKVIIEKNEDVSKGACRRLILKLLQRESIEWSEGDPGTIILDLEKINPTKLSFVKKK